MKGNVAGTSAGAAAGNPSATQIPGNGIGNAGAAGAGEPAKAAGSGDFFSSLAGDILHHENTGEPGEGANDGGTGEEQPDNEGGEGDPETTGKKASETTSQDFKEPLVIGPKTFKNLQELEQAYRQSYPEVRKLQAAISEREERLKFMAGKLAELEDKIPAEPPFKVLTNEEYEALSKQEQDEYNLQKLDWAREQRTAKEQRERMRKESADRQKDLEAFVSDRLDFMSVDPAFKDFNKLQPTMQAIAEKCPFLNGRRESPDILYFLALGMQAHGDSTAAAKKGQESQQEAARKAAEQATATASGSRTQTSTQKKNKHAEFLTAILKAKDKTYG